MQDKLTLIFFGIPPNPPAEESPRKKKIRKKIRKKKRRRPNRDAAVIAYFRTYRIETCYANGPDTWPMGPRDGRYEGAKLMEYSKAVDFTWLGAELS